MHQVVFTNVLIVGVLMWTVRALLLLTYTKQTLPPDWLLIKRHCIGMKGLPGVQLQINQITAAIGVIIAFTGKKMFYFS
jgi:hypothetical protein